MSKTTFIVFKDLFDMVPNLFFKELIDIAKDPDTYIILDIQEPHAVGWPGAMAYNPDPVSILSDMIIEGAASWEIRTALCHKVFVTAASKYKEEAPGVTPIRYFDAILTQHNRNPDRQLIVDGMINDEAVNIVQGHISDEVTEEIIKNYNLLIAEGFNAARWSRSAENTVHATWRTAIARCMPTRIMRVLRREFAGADAFFESRPDAEGSGIVTKEVLFMTTGDNSDNQEGMVLSPCIMEVDRTTPAKYGLVPASTVDQLRHYLKDLFSKSRNADAVMSAIYNICEDADDPERLIVTFDSRKVDWLTLVSEVNYLEGHKLVPFNTWVNMRWSFWLPGEIPLHVLRSRNIPV